MKFTHFVIIASILANRAEVAGQSVIDCSSGSVDADCILPYCVALGNSGQVLVMDNEDHYCSVQCPSSTGMLPFPLIGPEAQARIERRKKALSQLFAQTNLSTECAVRIRLASDSTVLNHPSNTCAVDSQLVVIVRRAIEALAHLNIELPEGSNGTFIIQQNTCGYIFPRYSEGSSSIIFPRRFVDDASVGEELMLFMLMHEIRHALPGAATEASADDWAARVGVPAYYGDEWLPDHAACFMERCTQQLRSFYHSVYAENSVFAAIALYPKLDCRIKLIKGGYIAGNCTSALPDSCMCAYMEGCLPVLTDRPMVKKPCALVCPTCPEHPVPETDTCVEVWSDLVGNDLCDIVSIVGKDPCGIPYPKCLLTPEQVARVMVQSLPSSRKHKRKLQRDVGRVEKRLLMFQKAWEEESKNPDAQPTRRK